jgi:two-component system, NarL family, sensor kinase
LLLWERLQREVKGRTGLGQLTVRRWASGLLPRLLTRRSVTHSHARKPESESLPPDACAFILNDLGMVLGVTAGDQVDPLLLGPRRGDMVKDLLPASPLLAQGLARALEEREPLTSRTLFRRDGRSRLVLASFAPGREGEGNELRLIPDDSELDAHVLWAENREALLNRVLHLLSRDLDISRTAGELLSVLVRGLRMEAAALFVGGGDREAELIAAYGRTRQRGFPYEELDLGDPFVADQLRRPRLVALSGTEKYQRALAAVLCRDVGTAVLVPAVAGRSVGGFLVLSRRDPRPLGFRDLNVLRATGQTLGLVLRNRVLSTESRQSAAVMETAYAVSRAISRSLDLDQTLREVALNAARIVDGAHCLLLEVEKGSNDLVAVASSEEESEALSGLRVSFGDGPDGLAELSSGRSLVVDDLVWGARVGPELRSRLQMHRALFLPMRSQGAVVGALLLYSSDRIHGFPAHEVARAEDIAEQAAIAIQNALLYRDLASSQARVAALVARIARVREQERQTFASLVHDDVVQTIVGAAYDLQASRTRLSLEHDEELEGIIEVLRQSIKDARRIIWELRPPVLDELGLPESLRSLAGRLDRDGPPRVHTVLEPLPELGQATSTAVYKIAREGLLNARRHASAERVHLRLSTEKNREGRWLRLEVADDGRGFDPGDVAAEDHYGLAMMEEQAAVVGGHVDISSSRDAGTKITVAIPFKDQQAR